MASPPLSLALLFAVIAVMAAAADTAPADDDDIGNNSADLIAAACNRTQYYDVCVSSLTPRVGATRGGVDLRGLAAISIGAGVAHAKATMSYARSLRKQKGFATDAYVSGCLGDCLEEYGDAVDSLHRSTAALRRGSYEKVNELVSGAMTNSDTCEGAFADKPGLHSPLTERNEYFFKLCSNSIAITSLLG
ncbi:hypothetical protein Cni_G15251 [Canna indica]|uniref:Pectinesterase inhibitor domain-containing protein n=1 Tax=Canna indica TaxID=4628 RepID=A0AAQ3KDS2_9LILI|nr:hypothetical protein Cni_G15251 [Canna indica]